MLTKGKYFWKKSWYSICSMHREHDETCNICKSGTWENNWLVVIDGFIHDHCYKLWYWNANRKPKKFMKYKK